MLKTTGYDIVFQEIPNEISLAINISNCPNHCPGCHSPYLQQDIGEVLTLNLLSEWIDNYKDAITCVVFMGGDSDLETIYECAVYIESEYPNLKIAQYSGREELDKRCVEYLDFIKLGPYKKELGSLKSRTTNQRLYKIENGQLNDITSSFWS